MAARVFDRMDRGKATTGQERTPRTPKGLNVLPRVPVGEEQADEGTLFENRILEMFRDICDRQSEIKDMIRELSESFVDKNEELKRNRELAEVGRRDRERAKLSMRKRRSREKAKR